MERNISLDMTKKISAWTRWVLVLSLSLFFFALPHTLEDFALGEPAKNGVPAPVLAFLVAGLFSLHGLALYWLGRERRSSYFLHAGLGLAWALAAGIEQLPVILASDSYRSGFISISYVAGMIVIGILLFLASLLALRTTGVRAVGKKEHA